MGQAIAGGTYFALCSVLQSSCVCNRNTLVIKNIVAVVINTVLKSKNTIRLRGETTS